MIKKLATAPSSDSGLIATFVEEMSAQDETELIGTRGERIQLILDETGLTQAELARAMNVERATVNKWIHNSTSDMRLDNLLWLEDKYGYLMRWIIRGKGPKKIDDTLEISDLSDEAKKPC